MALTRITKGVIKPNENYDTHNINSTGIVTAIGLDVNGNGDISGNLSVGGVLTYEDVTSIDSVGIITAQKDIHVGAGISAVGIITASSFRGDGSQLTGIDATSLKDSGGNVKIQAQASGAVHTGIATFQDIDVDGHTNLDNVSIAGVTTTTDDIIIGADNKKLKLGAGEELQLYQAGNHSVIQHNGSHYLQLRSDAHIMLDATGTKTVFFGDPNGQSALYFNGSKKLNTLNGGVDITGSLQVDALHCLGQINLDSDIDVDGHTNLDNVSIAGVTTFADTVHAEFGTDGDLQIWHDSGYNFIDAVSGNAGFFIRGRNNTTLQQPRLTIRNDANTEDIAKFIENGAVELYYDNAIKFQTQSYGASAIGQIYVSHSGTTPGFSLSDNGRSGWGSSNDLVIYHNGNNSYIDNKTGNLYIRCNTDGDDGGDIHIRAKSGENSVSCLDDGAVRLYQDCLEILSTKI